jgi:hypothetical protein
MEFPNAISNLEGLKKSLTSNKIIYVRTPENPKAH